MSRLMPGRVRQEGIALYEAGLLQVIEQNEEKLVASVEDEIFSYEMVADIMQCTCDQFAQKGYCTHMAAVEYFLKNNVEGRDLVQALQEENQLQDEMAEQASFGSAFLEKILPSDASVEVKYCLSAHGQLLPYDDNIDWTLKINRLPDSRGYIVRDVATFLQTVRKSGYYQIGKNYYEPLSLTAFDVASQDLIRFLWQLVPEKAGFDSQYGRTLRLPLPQLEDGLDLLNSLHHFSFEADGESYSQLYTYPLTADAGIFSTELTVQQRIITLSITGKSHRSLFHGAYLQHQNGLYAVQYEQRALLEALANLGKESVKTIQFGFKDQEKVALALMEFERIGTVSAPQRFRVVSLRPQFDFTLATDGGIDLALTLEGGGYHVRSQEDLDSLPFFSNVQELNRVKNLLVQAKFQGFFKAHRDALTEEALYQLYSQDLPKFRSLGAVKFSKELSDLFVTDGPNVNLDLAGNLLDVSFDFTGIAEEEITAALSSLLADEDYYRSRDGRMLIFDEETKKVSQTLQQLRAQFGQNGHANLDRLSGLRLSSQLSGHQQVHFSESFHQLAYDLAHPEAFHIQTPSVQADLRDYQELGVKWLSMLDSYGFGGILADDMGLGKTLQTIAFLRNQLEETSKVLILAPSSLIYNWEEEFAKFAPDVETLVVYGTKAERQNLLRLPHQVAITSYASFRQDKDLYRKERFDYLILDEAQVMKNAQTKTAQALRDFEVGACFALSGTPIENHLTEIWSIFQIVLPGLLPGKTEFGKLSAEEVAKLIQPFILRRRKEEVLQELPDLIEVTVQNELTEGQKALYLAQLRQMQATVSRISDTEIHQRKLEILSGITRLRQICDSPALFLDDYKGGSGKLAALKELLLQLREGGHRTLIFSQFRPMLELIETELADLGLDYYKLTGSTPAGERQEMTRAFNSGSRDAFLISLKAGGVGLNLTGADTVILVDLWWNPAVEEQAISRAHRMGQTEKVECYRLITRGTIEEKILLLQESKKNLVTTVLDGNESRASMTVEEIREILGIP